MRVYILSVSLSYPFHQTRVLGAFSTIELADKALYELKHHEEYKDWNKHITDVIVDKELPN